MARRRESVVPEGYPRPPFAYSPAVRFGSWVFTSGHMATDWVHGVAPTARLPYRNDGMAPQTVYIFRHLRALLDEAGSSMLHLLQSYHYFLTRRITRYSPTRKAFIPSQAPVGIAVEATRLLVPGVSYSVEHLAVTRDGPPKEILETDAVPLPGGGHYSQAIRRGDWVFAAGDMATDFQHPLAPEVDLDTRLWFREPIEEQTRYTLAKLGRILEHGGSSLEDVVYVRVALRDPEDVPGMERVWHETWPTNPPARAITFCNGLAATNALIEIYPIALVRGSRLPREAIETPNAPRPLFHHPQAMRVGDLLFLSTQMAADEQGLDPRVPIDPRLPYFGNAAARQMDVMLRNVEAICEAGGASLDSVLRTQLQFTDLTEFDAARAAWEARFAPAPPALSVAEVDGPFPVPGCTIQLDVVAGVAD